MAFSIISADLNAAARLRWGLFFRLFHGNLRDVDKAPKLFRMC